MSKHVVITTSLSEWGISRLIITTSSSSVINFVVVSTYHHFFKKLRRFFYSYRPKVAQYFDCNVNTWFEFWRKNIACDFLKFVLIKRSLSASVYLLSCLWFSLWYHAYSTQYSSVYKSVWHDRLWYILSLPSFTWTSSSTFLLQLLLLTAIIGSCYFFAVKQQLFYNNLFSE